MSRWFWVPASLYTAMILPTLLFPAPAHAISSTRTADTSAVLRARWVDAAVR